MKKKLLVDDGKTVQSWERARGVFIGFLLCDASGHRAVSPTGRMLEKMTFLHRFHKRSRGFEIISVCCVFSMREGLEN